MILQRFIVGPLSNNVYLFACGLGKKAAVVDPSSGSAAKIIKFLQDNDLELVYIFITHSHYDHIGDVAAVKAETGALLAIHEADKANLEVPGSDGLPSFFQKGAEPNFFLFDGQRLNLGNLEIEIIHTPGHSPGSVCLYVKEESLLFSGDTLFKHSMGRVDLPTSDAERMWGSLKKLSLLPANTRILSGHGEETTIGAESWLARAKDLFG